MNDGTIEIPLDDNIVVMCIECGAYLDVICTLCDDILSIAVFKCYCDELEL